MSFSDKLLTGEFIVTAEISPPKGTEIRPLLSEAARLKSLVDAINVTDNPRAIMRMSPAAVCWLLQGKGYETIMHITCRDRNRLALQSDLLGAHAMGIRNILIMTGDHPEKGDHEGAKPVYDLDSVQVLSLIRKLNNGFDCSGNRLEGMTDFTPGAVSNTQLSDVSMIKLRKKINMGASFIQTQAVFDTDSMSNFMDKIDMISSKRPVIIAGIIPLRSEKSARFLNENIAGIKVPDNIINRMREANDPASEGIEIAAELIRKLRSLCDGIHIMPIRDHKNTKHILETAGIR
ncbi:MAG: methylenetetrahydrofolate reductase [Candidatus Methanoperedens sp.]|nr:methylenetetrahydrofolate reductase [Candidatus Methanoperedens sp.]